MDKSYARVLSDGELEFYDTKVDGALTIEHDVPDYNKDTQVVGVSGYDVTQKDKVVVKYRVEQKPKTGQRFSLDEFVEMVAEKIAEKLR